MARLTRELSEMIGEGAGAIKSVVKEGAKFVVGSTELATDIVDKGGDTARNFLTVAQIRSKDLIADAEHEVRINSIQRDVQVEGIEEALKDPKTRARIVKISGDSFLKRLEEDVSF